MKARFSAARGFELIKTGQVCNDAQETVQVEYTVHNRFSGSPHGYTVTINSDTGTITCSCSGYEGDGLPCAHALRAIQEQNWQPFAPRCVHPTYHTETWLATFSSVSGVSPRAHKLLEVRQLLPPLAVRSRGRPRAVRIQSRGESSTSGTSTKRKGCTVCGKQGHYRNTCLPSRQHG